MQQCCMAMQQHHDTMQQCCMAMQQHHVPESGGQGLLSLDSKQTCTGVRSQWFTFMPETPRPSTTTTTWLSRRGTSWVSLVIPACHSNQVYSGVLWCILSEPNALTCHTVREGRGGGDMVC